MVACVVHPFDEKGVYIAVLQADNGYKQTAVYSPQLNQHHKVGEIMTQPVDNKLSYATLTPETAVIAGKLGTWTIDITIGQYGMSSGGHMKIAWRWVSDWGIPQFENPTAAGYTSVMTNGEAKFRASWHNRGYVRPKAPVCI